MSLASLSVYLLLAGCQLLGPAALGVGRGAYNEIIARTGSEQTLGLLVRLRYSDPIGLLAVTSVTAGLQFSAEAKSEGASGRTGIMPAPWCRSRRTSAMRTVRRFPILQ